MNISKITHIAMKKRIMNSQNPCEDCSVEHQSHEGEDSQKFNSLAVDSFHLVKNVPRTHLSRLLGGDDDNDDSESEFLDFEDCSGWLATNVQETAIPAKTRSSSVSLKAAAPAKRRSSVKHIIPLKDVTVTSRRSSAKTGGSRVNRLLNKMKRTTTRQDMRDLRERVRDTLGRDSLHLARNRMQCSKNAAKATK